MLYVVWVESHLLIACQTQNKEYCLIVEWLRTERDDTKRDETTFFKVKCRSGRPMHTKKPTEQRTRKTSLPFTEKKKKKKKEEKI